MTGNNISEMKNIGQRIQELIDISGLKVSSFATHTKNKQKNVANVVNGNNFPSWEVIFNICANAPGIVGLEDLDLQWLITGVKQEHGYSSGIIVEYEEKIEEIEVLKREIENLNKQLESKDSIVQLQDELLNNYRKQIEECKEVKAH